MSALFTIKQVGRILEVIHFDYASGVIRIKQTDRKGKYIPVSFTTRAFVTEQLAMLYLMQLQHKAVKKENDSHE